MKNCILLSVLLFSATMFAQDDAKTFREQGLSALAESQTNPDAVIKAATCFAKASALFEKAGQETDAQEANSCLYWCKKKMTMAQIDAFLKNTDLGTAAKQLDVAMKPKPVDESKAFFDRASAYAQAHPNEHLLVAIRYFEVADRFTNTEHGMKAQRLSLQEMQMVAQAPQPQQPGPPQKPRASANRKREEPLPTWPPNPETLKKVTPATLQSLPTPKLLEDLKNGDLKNFEESVRKLQLDSVNWSKEDFKARFDGWQILCYSANGYLAFDHLNSRNKIQSKDTAISQFQLGYALAAKTPEDFVDRVKASGVKQKGIVREYARQHRADFRNTASRERFCDTVVKLGIEDEDIETFRRKGL